MKGVGTMLVAVVVAAVLVQEVAPQGASVQINNQALFGLGAVLLASGVAYHVGRQNAINDQNGGRRRPNNGFPFFGRRRRQAEEEPLNELDPLVGRLFQMALDKDTTGCSLQLVCAIGGTPASTLTGHARNLQGVLSVKTGKSDANVKSPWNGLNAFRTAMDMGREGGDCNQLFPHCSNTSEELLETFQKLKVMEN